MVGIQGVGGVPEPKSERPAKVRDKEQQPVTSLPSKDDVVISSEAQAAAKLAQSIQVAMQETDVRADRVMAAQQNLERGDYRKPEIVAKVAERISKYLP